MAVPAGCLRLLWICESKIVQVEFIMPYPMWWACALHGHLPVPVPVPILSSPSSLPPPYYPIWPHHCCPRHGPSPPQCAFRCH